MKYMHALILLPFLVAFTSFFRCTTPTDLTQDPRMADIELSVVSSNGNSSTSFIEDTLGKEVTFRIKQKLQHLIDSVVIAVYSPSDTDTIISLASATEIIETSYAFATPGQRTVSALAFIRDGYKREYKCAVMIYRTASKIVAQQQDVSMPEGSTATLFVTLAQGVSAASFVWTKNDSILPVNARDTLTISFLSTAANGSYRCIVQYASGLADTSAPIRLTVTAAAAANSAPSLSITRPGGSLINNRTYASPAQACTLQLSIDDRDPEQQHAIIITADRTGWQLDTAAGRFTWIPTIADTGVAVFTFMVTDNGTPPLSASQTIVMTISATTPRPATPQAFHVAQRYQGTSAAQELIALSWRNSDFAQKYALYRTGEDSTFSMYRIALKDTFLVDTIVAGKHYSYYLVAINETGTSAPSEIAKTSDKALSTRSLQILSQPQKSLSAVTGTTVRLSILASGSDSLMFQWFHNGNSLAGRSDSFLIITPVEQSDSGVYHCIVGGRGDTTRISSQPCTLHVLAEAQPPAIQGALPDTAITFGDSWNLTVAATGSNILYQWFKNGYPLPGQTSSSLAFAFITFADSGRYVAKVYNSLDTAISDTAHITVKPLMYPVSVTIVGSGTVSPTAPGGVYMIERSKTQRFTFAPSSGSRIKSVSVDSAIDVTAASQGYYDFVNVREFHSLRVEFEAIPTTNYVLTTSTDATKGYIVRRPAQDTLAAGTSVEIEAVALAGFRFVGWSGNATGNQNPLAITLNSSMTITALFEQDTGAQTIALAPGNSLNAEIKKASAGPASQTIISPQPGMYDANTIEVLGKVSVVVKRK